MVVEVDRPQRTARLTPVAHVLAGLNGRGQADISLKLETMARLIAILTLLLLVASSPAQAQLRGHGGPVRALAISPDGKQAVSGSFDTSAIRWSLAKNAAEQVLRFHEGAVNAVIFLRDGRIATSGEDARIAIWTPGEPQPTKIFEGHEGPVVGLSLSPDGSTLASASWDHTARLWPLAGGAPRAPFIAVAVSHDGSRIAAAGMRGSVAIIDRLARKMERTLVGPGLPVWSAAFFPDGRTLLTGGSDRMILRWDAITGEPIGNLVIGAPEDPLAAFAGDPGAEVFRACIACHTLKADEGVRAGPTLAGVFGRKIATLPGYNFSEALKKLNIVWTPETVARLFEIGPMAYTPGTKMPEQRIGSVEDRDALVRFLERATKAK